MQVRRRGDHVEVRLSSDERRVLLGIVELLAEHVGSVPRTRPHAYDDLVKEAEYRRFTLPEVERSRSADIDLLRDCLRDGDGRWQLDEATALGWSRALNHLRLVAGGLLGVDDDTWHERLDPGTASTPEYRMFEALGLVQDRLVQVLDRL